MQDLASRTITEMMQSPAMIFRHGDFESIDAEDSIQQLCLLLYRLQVDYVPVVDPDDGTLVSILGYLDIVHLMDQAAKQHPHLFAETIELLCVNSFVDVVTAPRTAMLCDVLTVLSDRNIAAMPITDENGKVIGLYHKNDVTFVTRATDSEAVLSNLSELTVGDAVALQQQQLQSGEPMTTTPHVLVTCSLHDRLSVVLNAMMLVRSTVVVCVEDSGSCLGVIGIKDLIRYYFDGGVPVR
jgi:CBS domain-containing protein